MTDTTEAPLLRTPARFFFEAGFFGAYAEATVRNGNKPLFDLTDAAVDRAWHIAREGHPDPIEFDRYQYRADSGDQEMRDAEARYGELEAANRASDGSRESLEFSAELLRAYGQRLFPVTVDDRPHIGRVMMDAAASTIEAALARHSRPGPTVAQAGGIAMVEVRDGDRAELERGLITQGYRAEQAKALAADLRPNDAALQMLARHRLATLASAPAGKLDRGHTARRIKELVDECDGFWTACSGCQEGVDGYVSERDYPFDPMFRCQPGGGCSECGGIGVLWDNGRGYDNITGNEEPASAPAGAAGDIEWLSAQRRLSLAFYSPMYGDDDDQSEEWRVIKESGSINDREWDVIGRGATIAEAVAAARSAETDVGEAR